MISKRLILFGTERHAICINDYFMFFSQSCHSITHIFYPIGTHKNRNWWEQSYREDKARNNAVYPMRTYHGLITVWEKLERDVFPTLDKLEFDYICLGNGTDEAHVALVGRYGRDKVLFTEYGWLPWSEHFYISRKGAGIRSEIAELTQEDICSLTVNESEIAKLHQTLDIGETVPHEKYIYMPLQKDVNDFKFLYNDFQTNEEFIRFADKVAPADYKILVKSHPLYPKKYDLSFSNRMIDITHANLNKHILYRDMAAMICLNSTSILEALAYGATAFTYGDDLFVGKGVTYHRVLDKQDFAAGLETPINQELAKKFISLLFSRQVNRRKCIEHNSSYINRHYWNVCL